VKLSRILAGFSTIVLASCSSSSTGPSVGPTKPGEMATAGTEGTVSFASVAVTRMRLRLVGAGDIVTGLQTGQTINVPVNTRLDVWAEIQRLESDRARLVVDWGNGNTDFSGCGACRLENTYTEAGRYTLTARVLDLNDTTGTPAAAATVTINATGRLCSEILVDFESVAPFTFLPVTISGVTFEAPGFALVLGTLGSFSPVLTNNLLFVNPATPMKATFPSDRNQFSAGLYSDLGTPISYSALTAEGAVVASGTFVPIQSTGFGTQVMGTLTLTTPAPFRSVVLTNASAFGADNVSGSCH